MVGKISGTFKICLILALMLGQQVFGQQVNSVNSAILPPIFAPQKIATEKGNLWWLYPNGNGSKVLDIAGNFAVGAGGLIYDFPSSGFNFNLSSFRIYPTDSIAAFINPLNFRKILHQQQFGGRLNELLVQTDGDIFLLTDSADTYGSNIPYKYKSLLPDSLKGIRAAAFISFGSGVIIDKNNRIYRTLNAGQSWERRGLVPSGGIRNITITSVEDIFISYFSGALQYSSDGGVTFRLSANNNEVFSNISFFNDNFAIATSSFRFYSSSDRGSSWTELNAVPPGRPNYAQAITDSIWIVSTDSSIFQTNNAGLTYIRLTPACPVGRINKFTRTRTGGLPNWGGSTDVLAVIVNGNIITYDVSNGWMFSGLRQIDRYFNSFAFYNYGDNEDVSQLYISDTVLVGASGVKGINMLTSSGSEIRSGYAFFPSRNESDFGAKMWVKNSNGSVIISKFDNKIKLLNGRSESRIAYPTVTHLLLKNGVVYFIKPGTNYFYSLSQNNLAAIPDSVPLATQGSLIDLDANSNPNSFEIYFLGSDGKVFEYNIGTRFTRIINFPYPVEPIKLKLSKLLIGTPSFIGAVDNRGRIFAGETFSNTLSELNGTLITSFRDFDIVGDSLFAINTDNVFFATNISNPSSIIWDKDSIDISRTLTQVHIGYFNPTDTAIGARPGRLAMSRIRNENNQLPTLLLSGTGPSLISTNPRTWNYPFLSTKQKRTLPPLVLYPNPTKSRSFKISVENPEWVMVTDLTGKVVAQFNNPEKDIAFLLSANLSGGIYIVQAKTNKGISTGKLIVQ